MTKRPAVARVRPSTGRGVDAVVVGAGPAGAMAALALARGGASVLLLDRLAFPRDKACGDLLSPRAVSLLAGNGVRLPREHRADGMRLLGPTGRALELPWPRRSSHPPWGAAVRRVDLDAALLDTAISTGAEFRRANVADVLVERGSARGVVLDDGETVESSFVVGADGALSRVAAAAGLVDGQRALWGLALRSYGAGELDRPTIVYWEPPGERSFPGYGWVFPLAGRRLNVGLGVAVATDRSRATAVARLFPGFCAYLQDLGLVADVARDGRLGGWLRMGAVGVIPARANVLLAGDAAGLVNPLQGEGISAAMASGLHAANAILHTGGDAAAAYCERLFETDGRFYASSAALQELVLGSPRTFAFGGRALTASGVRRAVGPAWAMYWNNLTPAARPGATKALALVLSTAAAAFARRSAARRSVVETFGRRR